MKILHKVLVCIPLCMVYASPENSIKGLLNLTAPLLLNQNPSSSAGYRCLITRFNWGDCSWQGNYWDRTRWLLTLSNWNTGGNVPARVLNKPSTDGPCLD